MSTPAINVQYFYYKTILLRNQNQKWGLIFQAATENTQL